MSIAVDAGLKKKTADRGTVKGMITMAKYSFYKMYGLRVQSTCEIPELEPCDEGEADVEVTVETVEIPEGYAGENRISARRVDGEKIEVSVPGIGRFKAVRDRIVCQVFPGVSLGEMRIYLLGVVVAALLEQRGRLVLHGSCVSIGGSAVIIAGEKRSGKSTLTAALLARGHGLLNDDVTGIEVDGINGTASIRGGYPQCKMDPECARRFLGREPSELARVHPRFEKLKVPVVDHFCRGPLPLERIYFLGRGNEFLIDCLRGGDAIVRLIEHTMLSRFGASAFEGKSRKRHFRQCSDIIKSVDLCRLEVPDSLELLQQVAAGIEVDVLRVRGPEPVVRSECMYGCASA